METKKTVLINIRGISIASEEPDVIELFTTGDYYQEDGAFVIAYEETEATGFEGSRTLVRATPDCVVMERTGTARTQLMVEQGVRHQCCYDAGCGDMMIGVSGSTIKFDLNEQGGDLFFSYNIDINSIQASENKMFIHVQEDAPNAERTEQNT